MEIWSRVDPAWRRAFELAWDAYGAGTITVGAVVTDADGMLPVTFFLERRGPEHYGTAAYRARRPQLVAEVLRLRERADEPLDDVVGQLADALQSA